MTTLTSVLASIAREEIDFCLSGLSDRPGATILYVADTRDGHHIRLNLVYYKGVTGPDTFRVTKGGRDGDLVLDCALTGDRVAAACGGMIDGVTPPTGEAAAAAWLVGLRDLALRADGQMFGYRPFVA